MGGDDEEGFGESPGFLSDGDFFFLHGLEECGLRFWGSTVDFVGEQDVGEDGAFDEPEFTASGFVFVEHIGAGDIGRHQVRGELNAAELDIEQFGDGADDECFGESGDSNEETVAAGEDGGEDLINNRILSDDDFMEFLFHHFVVAVEFFKELVEIAFFGHCVQILLGAMEDAAVVRGC